MKTTWITLLLLISFSALLPYTLIILIKIVPCLIPYLYSYFFSNITVKRTLQEIPKYNNINETAKAIMLWEKSNLVNAYGSWQFSCLCYHGGNICIHVNNGPIPWVLYSKDATCRDYANVFVYLMEKREFQARIIQVPGEDHAWAEYYDNGKWFAVDPSQNLFIKNKMEYAKNKGWSYVEAIYFNGTKCDVSDNYIYRGKLVVKVFNGRYPINGSKVSIYSMFLMKKYPNKYKFPKRVISSITDKNGTAVFRLGKNEYKVEVIFDDYHKNKTIKIEPNQTYTLLFQINR